MVEFVAGLCWASISNATRPPLANIGILRFGFTTWITAVSSCIKCCSNPSITAGLVIRTWHWYRCEVRTRSYQHSVDNLTKERWIENRRRQRWSTKEKRKKTEGIDVTTRNSNSMSFTMCLCNFSSSSK